MSLLCLPPDDIVTKLSDKNNRAGTHTYELADQKKQVNSPITLIKDMTSQMYYVCFGCKRN